MVASPRADPRPGVARCARGSMPYGYSAGRRRTTSRRSTTSSISTSFYIHNKRSASRGHALRRRVAVADPGHHHHCRRAASDGAHCHAGRRRAGAPVWFRFWRVAIIPVTVLFTSTPRCSGTSTRSWARGAVSFLHPAHGPGRGTLRAPATTAQRMIWFIVSLLLVYGTQLESKTYVLFALLLVGCA